MRQFLRSYSAHRRVYSIVQSYQIVQREAIYILVLTVHRECDSGIFLKVSTINPNDYIKLVTHVTKTKRPNNKLLTPVTVTKYDKIS